MKAALYARVSTVDKDQNPEVQMSSLREYCRSMGWEIYQEYVDHASAVDMLARVAWQDLLRAASRHQFDILLVWKLDRAFRSVSHAANTLEQLKNYKIQFKSYTESFMDTTSPQGEFIFHIMVAAAGLERQMIAQRVRAGMDYAKRHGTKTGKSIGRPRKRISDARIHKVFDETGGNYYQTAGILGVKPGFVFNRLNRPPQNLPRKSRRRRG
jgi:DNA invertase Pin-like site-specific DNA recombinase